MPKTDPCECYNIPFSVEAQPANKHYKIRSVRVTHDTSLYAYLDTATKSGEFTFRKGDRVAALVPKIINLPLNSPLRKQEARFRWQSHTTNV